LFLLLFLVLVTAPRLTAENLLLNGGFEQDELRMLAMWSTEAYLYSEDAVRFFATEQACYSGRRSLAIANLKPNDSRAVQWVKVRPNTLYRLSCRILAQQVEAGSVGANISVLGSTSAAGDLRDTGGRWEHVELYGRTGPSQESLGVLVRLGFYGSLASGVALFDDVRLEEVGAATAGDAGKVISFAENREDRIFRAMRAAPQEALRTLPAAGPDRTTVAGQAASGGAGSAAGGLGRFALQNGIRWPVTAGLAALALALLVTTVVALIRLGQLRQQRRAWPAGGPGRRGQTGKISIQSLIDGTEAQTAGPRKHDLGGHFSLRGRRRQDTPREIEHRGLARAATDAEVLIRRAARRGGKAEVLKLAGGNISDSGLYCNGPEPRSLFLDERVNVEMTRGTRLVDLGQAAVVRAEAGHAAKGPAREGGYGFCFLQPPEAIRKLRRGLYEAPASRGTGSAKRVRAGALPP
jgi:hypothetical protein